MGKAVSDKKVSVDKEIVGRVLSGDKRALKKFVKAHTDAVLYRVWTLMKSHCNQPSRDRLCTILMLRRKLTGSVRPSSDDLLCDECMDSYIWLFEYIKKRLKSYKAINDCSLTTYVRSIIDSRTTYVDWLRWKYGRAF